VTIALRPATAADIPFILSVERIPGHDAFIQRWSEEQHAAALPNPSYAYFIALGPGGAPAGFAMLSERDDAHGNHCLKRIAMAEPGRGLGAPFFSAVIDQAFGCPHAHRVWLYVFADNPRARHVYAAQGFTEEGQLREARLRTDGTRVALVTMSMLRPEWQARHCRSPVGN
jgi:RimJ/RimL family protein N-acetyltransferase